MCIRDSPETPEDPDEPNEEIKDFVRRCYLIALDREPDAQGYADWTRWLADGTVDGKGCVYGFIFSREMEDKNLDIRLFFTQPEHLGVFQCQMGVHHQAAQAVSYTHLDVYKRQGRHSAAPSRSAH